MSVQRSHVLALAPRLTPTPACDSQLDAQRHVHNSVVLIRGGGPCSSLPFAFLLRRVCVLDAAVECVLVLSDMR